MDIKVLGETMSLSTANTVDDATNVLLTNNTEGAVLITRTDADDNVVGSFVLLAGVMVTAIKAPTDTFTSNVAIAASKVAYSN